MAFDHESPHKGATESWYVDETRLVINHDDQVKLEEKSVAKAPGANTSPLRVSSGETTKFI